MSSTGFTGPVPSCVTVPGDPWPDREYGTSLTILASGISGLDRTYRGRVESEVEECSAGRRVVLFEQRRGSDRELGANRSGVAPAGGSFVGQLPEKDWPIVSADLRRGARVYAKAPRDERSGSVCRADRSKVLLHGITNE